MADGESRASAFPEMLLTVCLVVLFCGAAVRELSGTASVRAQQVSAVGPAAAAQAAHPTIAEKIAASQQLLDINTATAAALDGLPGMGAAYTARIVAGRPYTAKNQLVTRGILPKDEYERIRELIIAHRLKK